MKDPAFLFYPQDFLIGTAELSNEEVGQYIRILSYMHQKGRLKEETIRLLVGSISDNVRLKFGLDSDSKLFNRRLEEEMEKRANFTKSRRENGSKGGRPKKDSKPLGLAKDNLMGNENENGNKGGVGENKPMFPNVKEAFIFNVNQTAKEIGISDKDLQSFIEHWTGYDYETKKYMWQSQESFNLKTRLKNWKEKSNQINKNGGEVKHNYL